MSEDFKQENNNEQDDHKLPWHNGNKKTLKFLAICLSAFLGGLVGMMILGSVFTLAHKNAKLYRPEPPKMDNMMFMPRDFFEDFEAENSEIQKDLQIPPKPPIPRGKRIVTLEENAESYRLYIDLNRFNNDEDNVKLTIKPREIKINGNSNVKYKAEESTFSFSQNIRLDKKIDVKDVTRQKIGNQLVVTLPIED